MPPIDESASFDPKAATAEGRRSRSTASAPEQPTSADLVALTIEPESGRLVKVERVDAAGERHELSDEERTLLVNTKARATLERVLEQAFEAGIDVVLGDGAAQKEPPESPDDAELSRVLLRSLFERSGAKQLMQRDILKQAIVSTLIEDLAGDGGAAAH